MTGSLNLARQAAYHINILEQAMVFLSIPYIVDMEVYRPHPMVEECGDIHQLPFTKCEKCGSEG